MLLSLIFQKKHLYKCLKNNEKKLVTNYCIKKANFIYASSQILSASEASFFVNAALYNLHNNNNNIDMYMPWFQMQF